jgi:hypothetical protein
MSWSKDEVATLKLSASWNDTAEEIAYMLARDPEDIVAKARELGIRLGRLHELSRGRFALRESM